MTCEKEAHASFQAAFSGLDTCIACDLEQAYEQIATLQDDLSYQEKEKANYRQQIARQAVRISKLEEIIADLRMKENRD